ncbi:50S ribosomal protein L32 [Candidatus Falkowbacteria bacterium HGW-Falkowbacteria-1]|jgi:large subunit ribosomal protein L32|uniref:Large ribosomal subunit protein bL32 n=1 Tax=Candidatus Falkowbacteria bacterium HGW-Falkowbacteria-1 TaxID=2013768 RepID=A0A2N2E8K0_9BACT|nr:MAG: 50S ribosomal protein L32 [Candidatus Falkowbacteria bacterium HGW-Falkowbacteria-1]
MSVPKKRKTSSSTKQQRSHHSLKKQTLGSCPKCGQAVRPHIACSFCGTYKGKAVLKVENKVKNKK